MLGSEVRSEVDDLPDAESNESQGDADGEELDSSVSGLVGVSQPDLSHLEVVHFLVHLIDDLLDLSQLHLCGLELFGGLDLLPVSGVGSNGDRQINLLGLSEILVRVGHVVEAHVQSSVLMRAKGGDLSAQNILDSGVLVSMCVSNDHAQLLAVSVLGRLDSDDNELAVLDKVSHTKGQLVLVLGRQHKPQGGHGVDEEQQGQHAHDGFHGWRSVCVCVELKR
jgi:hypothetical protein